ncbi:MAG TPA: hypothetical protein VIU44_07620 [Gaiellaceae bacterium]
MSPDSSAIPERSDFIREVVAADVREGRVSEVVTRFPVRSGKGKPGIASTNS